MRTSVRLTFFVGVLTCAAIVGAPAFYARAQSTLPKKVSVTFPGPTVTFRPGPNLGIVQANCLVCHNADYIYFQPPLTRAAWTAEVNKMRNVYKAQIADSDVDKIVDYLMSQNGKT